MYSGYVIYNYFKFEMLLHVFILVEQFLLDYILPHFAIVNSKHDMFIFV